MAQSQVAWPDDDDSTQRLAVVSAQNLAVIATSLERIANAASGLEDIADTLSGTIDLLVKAVTDEDGSALLYALRSGRSK